ncbi:hypothetical protein [Streptomyces sp.]|uniref:hypothetical protein n=1 Tax=Streptomyces sp. TaxID=1931 RepID=UPI0025CC7832|nr:hypothetical protein [Streptomyces sp.]
MPVAAARPISLTVAEGHRPKKAAYGHKTPHQDRVRAQIVLHAARGAATRASPAKRERTWTPCAPGGAASPTAA